MTRFRSPCVRRPIWRARNEFTVFWKIIIPLSKPIIVYTVINSFLAPWMDFIFASIMLNSGISAQKTVAPGSVRHGGQGEPQQLLRAVLRRRRYRFHPDLHPLRHHAEVLRRRHHGWLCEGVTEWGTPGEAAFLRKAPPPGPLPESGWRLSWLLLRSWFRLRGGYVSDWLGCGHGG